MNELARQVDTTQLLREWLTSLQSSDQPWALFVTVTMRRFDEMSRQPWSIHIVDRAITRFAYRLQQSVFNHAYSREKRRSLGIICMRHLGPYGIHPHYHLVLSRPDWIGLKDLEAKVCAVAKRINWIDREIDFETYYSTGAIGYLTSDLYWEPVYEACEAAK